MDREHKKLRVNPEEAPLVQHIFRRYTQLASAKALAAEFNEQGYRTKSWTTKKGKHRPGSPWNTGHIYRLLGNRTYMGEVVHKGKGYPGEHETIVSKGLWERVQAVLSEHTRARRTKAKTKLISPLQGVVRCGHCDGAMGLTYTQKGPRRYTYYHCAKDAKRAVSRCQVKRVPAGDIEKAVLEQLSAVFRTPTLMSQTYFAAKGMEEVERERLLKQKERLDVSARAQAFEADRVAEREVAEAFQSVETFWEDLFPLERNRLIRLLVEKVEVRETGIDMELKTRGLTSLVIELSGLASEARERSHGR